MLFWIAEYLKFIFYVIFQRKYGSKLQQWPRLYHLLRHYEHGYVRKVARIFTKNEILAALQIDSDTPKWTLRKAAIALSYCGGLRCAELKSIKRGHVSVQEDGIWIRYNQAKQRGEQKDNKFLIPFNRAKPELCFGTRVVHYLEMLKKSIPHLADDESLFQTPLKKGFKQQTTGRNTMHDIGKEVARELNLPEPIAYTGMYACKQVY